MRWKSGQEGKEAEHETESLGSLPPNPSAATFQMKDSVFDGVMVSLAVSIQFLPPSLPPNTTSQLHLPPSCPPGFPPSPPLPHNSASNPPVQSASPGAPVAI